MVITVRFCRTVLSIWNYVKSILWLILEINFAVKNVFIIQIIAASYWLLKVQGRSARLGRWRSLVNRLMRILYILTSILIQEWRICFQQTWIQTAWLWDWNCMPEAVQSFAESKDFNEVRAENPCALEQSSVAARQRE